MWISSTATRRNTIRLTVISFYILIAWGGGTPAGSPLDHRLPRCRGLVVLQFDDSYDDHWISAYPILQDWGVKGSFGIVTGWLDEPGRLTRSQVVTMAASGHEIHDHTLYHDPALWGDTANADLWPVNIEASLAIFAEMGLSTRGWNQPGGPGEGFSPQLRDTLKKYYDYAAGRVGITWSQKFNFHWNLHDDPYSLGRVVDSWGYNGGGSTAQETNNVIAGIADGCARGLVVIPVFHLVTSSDSIDWALSRICSTIVENDIECLRMADAVYRVQHSHEYFSAWDNQMPNPDFDYDIDYNGKPDAWYLLTYAPPEVDAEIPERVGEITHEGGTVVYGPEPGELEFCFQARAEFVDEIYVKTEFTEIDEDFSYTVYTYSVEYLQLGPEWETYCYSLVVPENTDRIKFIYGDISTKAYVAGPSLVLVSATSPCYVSPTELDFGVVDVGDYADQAFTITNTGVDTVAGSFSESCDHYSITSGEGSYSLGPSESMEVTIRFEPGCEGSQACTIETGNELCCYVSCIGSTPPPIPAVSEWGLIIMGLLLLTAGVIVLRRRVAAE